MPEEFEIEYKSMLTKEEFDSLMQACGIADTSFFEQTNHYFDTADGDIKGHGAALRLRIKQEEAVLTLKQKAEGGHKEIHQPLAWTDDLLSPASWPAGDTVQLLEEWQIDLADIEYLGELTTRRCEQPVGAGTIVIDHSTYLGHEDFEVEFETEDPDEGWKAFKTLLDGNHIPFRKSKNKIERFFKKLTEYR